MISLQVLLQSCSLLLSASMSASTALKDEASNCTDLDFSDPVCLALENEKNVSESKLYLYARNYYCRYFWIHLGDLLFVVDFDHIQICHRAFDTLSQTSVCDEYSGYNSIDGNGCLYPSHAQRYGVRV